MNYAINAFSVTTMIMEKFKFSLLRLGIFSRIYLILVLGRVTER